MDIYNPNRDITEEFTRTASHWIAQSGEVLVVMRYLRAGGQKDYALCCTAEDFDRIIQLVPRGTDIVVFRSRQLPLRGVCTQPFVADALKEIPDGTEFLLVETERKSPRDPRIRGELGDNHRDLQESLCSADGLKVAIGVCPRFFEADSTDMISASKGGIDGPR